MAMDDLLFNKSDEMLSPAELHRRERLKIQQQHRGHEAMHAEMLLILFLTMIVVQVILFEWKRRSVRTYQMVTLFAMWIIPVVLSINNHYWRFIFFWLVFTCITGLVFRKAIENPIQKRTPRLVYKWFYFVYIFSYALGIIGYVVFISTLLGVNFIFNVAPQSCMDSAVLLTFYGLYYGVLGRDIAEISSDKIASQVGYYSAEGLPSRQLEQDVCAVCGNKLLVGVEEEGIIENTYKLSCDHVFHEFCIRGWCIVGKKQTCPYCNEKVDLKQMFCNPWERPHVLYGQLLDWLRLLVAWQPVILFIVQAINYVLGLE